MRVTGRRGGCSGRGRATLASVASRGTAGAKVEIPALCLQETGETSTGQGRKLLYFFSAIFREISAMSLGRRSASTLSTILAMAAGSELEDATEASCTICSAPAATALAAVSAGADSGTSNSLGWERATSLPLLVSRI